MFIENPQLAFQSAEQIKRYQEERLQGALAYLKRNSPFYQRLFKKNGVELGNIKRLEDLSNIPVTTKEDLQRYNQDFWCVPRSKIADFITTSGTLGNPVTFATTARDLERLAYNEFLSFLCADGSSKDVYQLMVTLDKRFMAGLAYLLGIQKLGAGMVRVGPGSPAFQWDTIERVKPNALVAVPSFIVKLLEYATRNGIDFQSSSVEKIICIGESFRNQDFSLNTLGKRIKEQWDVHLYATYASTEMSTAFTECRSGIGGHLIPDLIIVELLDENNLPVKEGAPGEVTITTLGVEAMPLLRFKTGDICHIDRSPCPCGRNALRLGPVIGRKKQMIKFKGTTLYPPSINNVLNGIEQIDDYIVKLSTGELGTDEITIDIATKFPSDRFLSYIQQQFKAKLRVTPVIRFVHPKELSKQKFPSMARKPVSLIDNRIKSLRK